MPVFSSIFPFLYTVGIPRAREELATFNLDVKAIHFVAIQIWAGLTTALCNQLSEILGGPWRNDCTSSKWGTQEGAYPSTIILEMITLTLGKGEIAGLKVTLIQADICTSMFRAALFTITKGGGTPSTDEWVNKM